MEAQDQKFYDIVADEIRSRSIVDGLWVRAFSDAGGDEAKAKAIYIAHRVEQLKAQAQAAKKAAFEREQAEARRVSLERARAQREEKERPAREKEAERQRLWQSVPARELRPVNPIVLLLLFALLVAPFLLMWLLL